jgi:hypothetical protein
VAVSKLREVRLSTAFVTSTFTRVDRFDDHFEGAWPKSDLALWGEVIGFDVPSFTDRMRRRIAASCWVESPNESAAMWRLYAGGNEGVAVTTTFGKLHSLVTTGDGSMAGAGRVRYLDHVNKGLIEDLGKDEPLPNTMMPFMLKNVSCEHKREVRALVISDFEEVPSDGFDLPVNLNDFIDEIVVNPFCGAWFTEAVAGVAGRYDLNIKHHRSSLSPDLFYVARQEGKR